MGTGAIVRTGLEGDKAADGGVGAVGVGFEPHAAVNATSNSARQHWVALIFLSTTGI